MRKRRPAAWRSPPKPKPAPKPAPKRETVELVGGGIYWSEDGWRTIYRRHRPSRYGRTNESVPQRVDDKVEADRIRYLAVVKYGGGRDDSVP